MSPTPETATDRARDEDARELRTGLAFLLSPGIAALLGPVTLLLFPEEGYRLDIDFYVFLAFCFAVVGYLTALILAVPIYLALPEGARVASVVVPLAGVLAAAPWMLGSALSKGSSPEYIAVPIAFGLGCIGGVAFVLIRGGAGARRPGR